MPADQETAALLGVSEKEVPWVQCLLNHKEKISKKRKESEDSVAPNNQRMEMRPIFSEDTLLAERQQLFFGDCLRVFQHPRDGHCIQDACVPEDDLEQQDLYGPLYP